MTLSVALLGTDLIGQARTGTGKTLAFGIPLILAAFGAVLWTRGFGPEDRELFKMRKADIAELNEAESDATPRP